MVDPSGTTIFSYDKRGNIVVETRTSTGYSSFQTGYGYDKKQQPHKNHLSFMKRGKLCYNNQVEVTPMT